MYQYRIEVKSHFEDDESFVRFLDAKDYRLDLDTRKSTGETGSRTVLNLFKDLTVDDSGMSLTEIYDSFIFDAAPEADIKNIMSFQTILKETGEVVYNMKDMEVKSARINISAQNDGLDGMSNELVLVKRLSIDF